MKNWKWTAFLLCLITMSSLSATPEKSKKVVLVLGSGGNKGLAHVGVIEELEHLGIVPDVILGCSCGAIIGALYAQHTDIAEVKKILIDLKYDDLIDFSLFQKQAISTPNKLQNFLDSHLKSKDFSSLKTKLIVVATDLQKGEPIYLTEGELHPAILASAALPGLFPPCQIGDKICVDGGVCDPLPVSFAKSLEECVVIASDISPSLKDFEIDDLPGVIRKSFEIAYQRLAYSEKKRADLLLAMEFPPHLDSPFEDSANQQIYERGKEAVRNQAEQILKLVSDCKNP